MKSLLALFALVTLFTTSQASASELSMPSNEGQYTCVRQRDSVCMVNNQTGKCVHKWSEYDVLSPMRQCQKMANQAPTSMPLPSHYVCVDKRHYACAFNTKTGQCIQKWARYDYPRPMSQCQKYLGHTTSRSDMNQHRCRPFAVKSACLENTTTGRCTHRFYSYDYSNPMRACMKHLVK